jgi:hypothetical protein
VIVVPTGILVPEMAVPTSPEAKVPVVQVNVVLLPLVEHPDIALGVVVSDTGPLGLLEELFFHFRRTRLATLLVL